MRLPRSIGPYAALASAFVSGDEGKHIVLTGEPDKALGHVPEHGCHSWRYARVVRLVLILPGEMPAFFRRLHSHDLPAFMVQRAVTWRAWRTYIEKISAVEIATVSAPRAITEAVNRRSRLMVVPRNVALPRYPDLSGGL